MSVTGGPDISTDGLILCLDVGNKNSYPGSGNTWYDLSGYDNHGTLTNGPTFDGQNKGSISFDGADDYISTTFVLNGSTTFTVSCWFKLDTVTKYWNSIVDAYKDSADRNFQLWVNGNSKLYIYHLGASHSGDGLLTINTWYNAVFSYTGSGNGILYLNGSILNGSIPKGVNAGGNISVNIGRRADANASSYTDGNIAQVSIYNKALTADEILQNYNAVKGRFGL